MKKICEYCGSQFEAKRSTARFCSDAHRAQNAYAEKHRVVKPILGHAFSFRVQQREAINRLEKLSAPASDGLTDVVATFGYRAGLLVLHNVVEPLYEAWRVAYNDLQETHKSTDANTPTQTWKWEDLGYEGKTIVGQVAIFGFYRQPRPWVPEWARESMASGRPESADKLVAQGILVFHSANDVYEFAPGVTSQSFTLESNRNVDPLLP